MGSTYPDWREPARTLERSTGPATDGQRSLASKVGLRLDGKEPHDVVGVLLEEHLRPIIWGTEAAPATERQRGFLMSLDAAQATDTSLSRPVASAWISHHLARRNLQSLRTLKLKRGDAIIRLKRWVDPATGELHESREQFRVSSIGPAGLVYFLGGNGQCGWASSLERA